VNVLTILTVGTDDATKASVPIHLAVNGAVEVGDEVTVILAGDATGYLAGDAIAKAEGIGVPPLRDLVAKMKDRATVFV